jgi:hypothetical protein
VFKRIALFLGWAVVGLFGTYGALYAFTPYGLVILGLCLGFAFALQAAGGGDQLDVLGLIAGPGLFCLLVASSAEEAVATWATAGGAIVGVALATYVVVGRARCTRRA